MKKLAKCHLGYIFLQKMKMVIVNGQKKVNSKIKRSELIHFSELIQNLSVKICGLIFTGLKLLNPKKILFVFLT